MLKKLFTPERMTQIKDTFWTSARILKIVWQVDKRLFLINIVATIIPGVVPFFNTYIYKLVIDQVAAILQGAPFNPSVFYPLIGLRVASFFLGSVAFRVQDVVERLLWTKVPITLNQMILRKISDLDIYYFENDQFRDLLERVRDSQDFRPQNLVSNLLYSMQSIIQIAISFIALARLNYLFVFLIALVSIPEFIVQTYQSKLYWGIWMYNSPFRKKYNYLSHLLQRHGEVKEIRIFQLANNFLTEIKRLQTKFYEENKSKALKTFGLDSLFQFFSTIVYIGIEIYVIFQAIGRRLTLGDISFYTSMVSNFQNGLGGFLRTANQIFDQSLYVKSIFDLMELEPKVKMPEHPVPLNIKKAPKIEFRNVSFKYPDTKASIFKNFSLTINPGEKVAFVGENGAGKSTMIKLLARFYDVDEGEILINDINIKDVDLKDWYKYMGVLFQDFNKYETTAGENIRFGDIDIPDDTEKIINASVSAGSHSMIQKYEKQYEQMLGRMFEEGIEPSGGQWQKIALARAFFRNAPILVLDEPTAAIDARAESEIFERVERLSRDKTVIIISHRFSTVRNADKIYVIDNGKIVESGSHQKLMKLDGQYATLFNLQAKGYR